MKKPKFRPSNSERFLNCNLSLWLPEKQKTEAQESYLAERSKEHERLAEGNFLASEEKCEKYHDFVFIRSGDNLFREKKLSIEIGGEPFEGTPDLFGFDEKTNVAFIIDYKTGFYNVSALHNAQLLSYAALVLLTHKEWDIKEFCLSILNTRADITSHYYPKIETVLKHIANIERSFQFIEEGTCYSVKGDWCRFCPSKDYCPLQIDIKETKDLMDSNVDELIYAKEMRAKEIRSRVKELKEKSDSSNVFCYELTGTKKRFKVLENT